VHIDKKGVFDPNRFYRDAKITYAEIRFVIENLWKLLSELYVEHFGKAYPHTQLSIESLCKDFKRDFLKLSARSTVVKS